MDTSILASPRRGLRKEDCFFYHVNDIPGVGQVGEHWDLRATIDDYLGHYDFSGRTVLDVGTASGYLTFEMEKRGADVVSFDVENARVTEIVPYYNDPCGKEQLWASQEIGFDRLKNSYWFCHEHLNSTARAFYGNVYRLPAALGVFDIAMVGMCLPHMRDPLGALESIAARTKDTVIITQQTLHEEAPFMQMMAYPNPEHLEHVRFAWWMLSDGCITNFMAILGFRLQRKSCATHKCIAYTPARYEECTSFVFQRCAEAT